VKTEHRAAPRTGAKELRNARLHGADSNAGARGVEIIDLSESGARFRLESSSEQGPGLPSKYPAVPCA
jgi:hypothetical protein